MPNEYTDLIAEPAPVSATPEANPYVDLVASNEAARATALADSLRQAAKTKPDRVAQVKTLADRFGLPAAVVDKHYDLVSQRAAMSEQDANGLLDKHPELAAWLAHPDNAGLVSDDMPGLRQLDFVIRQMTNPTQDPSGILPNGFVFGEDGGIMEVGQGGHFAYRVGGFPELEARLKEREQDWEALRARTSGPFMTGLMGSLASTVNLFGGNQEAANAADWQSIASGQLDPGAQSLFDFAGWGNDLARGAGGVVGDVPLMIAGGPFGRVTQTLQRASRFRAVLAKAVGKTGARIASTGIDVAAVSQPLAMREGLATQREHGSADGAMAWLIETAVPAAFGRTGVDRALLGAAGPTGVGFARKLLTDAGLEGTEEVATELAHALHEATSGINPKALEPESLLRRLTVAGILGAGAGGVFNLPNAIGEHAYQQVNAAEQAVAARDRVAAVLDVAKAAKLNERDPSALRGLIDRLIGTGKRSVFFQSSDWQAHWEAAGQDPIAMAEQFGVRDEYLTALAHGGEMPVAVSSLAVGGEDVGALLEFMRSEPGAMTPAEAIKYTDGVSPEMQALADALGTVPETEQQPDTAQDVRANILEQLTAVGIDAQSADQYATLFESVFRALGTRTGQDPKALFDKYGVRIQRGVDGVEADGRVEAIDGLLERVKAGQIPSAESIAEDDGDAAAYREALLEVQAHLRDAGIDPATADMDTMRRAINGTLEAEPQQEAAQTVLPQSERVPAAGVRLTRVEALLAGRERERAKAKPSDPNAETGRITRLNQSINDIGVRVGGPGQAPSLDVIDAMLDWPGMRGHLETVGNLGFDSADQALDAIMAHDDWSTRWDVEYGRSEQEDAALRYLKGARTRAVNARPGSFPGDGTILAQGKRGNISFGAARQFTISLFQRADLSTFLHESGHLYLEVLGDLATAKDADPQLAADYAAALAWMGVTSRAEIQDAHHEKWARGFEAYLREGRAPTSALRRAFARFRAWLVDIYRDVAGLNVELDDSIRRVFDRLVASQDEINAARLRAGVQPVFATAAQAGMTDAEFAAYQQSAEDARQQAEDKLVAEMLREEQAERSRQYRLAREKLRPQAEAAVNRRPDIIAKAVLLTGKMPDGSPLPFDIQSLKLDRQAIVNAPYGGEAMLKKLPRGFRSWVYSKEGVHPDHAAEILGFRSGQDLTLALANAPTRASLVEAELASRLQEQFGDMRLDGRAAAAAIDAVHSEKRGDLLVEEARRLGARAGQRAAPHELLKAAARATVAKQQVRNLRPDLYRVAEAKAAREAFEAAAKEDHDAAFLAKQRELLNHELFRAATDAKAMAEKAGEYLAGMNESAARERIGKAGGWEWTVTLPDGTSRTFPSEDQAKALSAANGRAPFARTSSYLDQIDGLLERYELRQVSGKRLSKRESLLAWVRRMEHEGEPVSVPESLLHDAAQVNWRQQTVAQVEALRNGVRNIEHLARNKRKLMAQRRKADFAEIVQGANDSIKAHGTLKKRAAQTTQGEAGKDYLGGFIAAHRKFSSLVRVMDGGSDGGVLWDLLVRPLNEAADREAAMRQRATVEMSALFRTWGKSLAFDPYTKVNVPEVGESFTRLGLISVALNWGNADNRARLMARGWNEQQVQAILEKLDAADLKLVQGIIDHIGSYWSEIAAQEQRIHGVAPTKIAPTPIMTRAGTIPGGYYPIKYDGTQSTGNRQDVASMLEAGSFVKAMPFNGFTKDRAFAPPPGQVIKLDVGVAFQHVNNVIHYVSYYDTLSDAGKLLGPGGVADSIVAYHGHHALRQMRTTLTDAAVGDAPAADNVEKLMGYLRTGAVISSMGFNLTSAAMQVTGVSQSIVRTGVLHFAKAVARVYGGPAALKEAADFIDGKSTFMRLRGSTQMRELNELANQVGVTSPFKAFSRSGFWMIAKMQRSVDMPTWMAAYEKALDEGADDAAAVALADQTVRDTQGSGLVHDLAAVQRGGAWRKLFTTFYSYFNTTLNLTAESVAKARAAGVSGIPALAVDMLLLYSVPVVFGDLIRRALAGGDDEDTEEYAKRMAKAHVGYLLGTIVLGRELGGRFGYSGPAGARAFDVLAGAGSQVAQGEMDEAAAKKLVTAAGILFHVPTTPLVRLLDATMEPGKKTSQVRQALFGRPVQ